MKSRRNAPGSDEYFTGLSERLSIARRLVENRQVDAARLVGCDPRTWFRYERGTREVDTYTLAKFSLQYDVCPKFLLLGDASGLRWPLSANIRTIPEAAKYLPAPQPGADAPASHAAMPREAAEKVHNRPLVRQP